MKSSEKPLEQNAQLIHQLAVGLQSTSTLIQGLHRSIQDNSLTLVAFEGEILGLQRTVSSLNRVLQEGDGKASILTRVAILENEVVAVVKDLEMFIASQSKKQERVRRESVALVKQELDSKLKVKLSKHQLAAVVIPAFLAFVVSVITYLIK